MTIEYSNINIETNKQWQHARSARNIVDKKQRLAELQYMRDLFNEKLPVGEELTEIQSYFDNIEQIIERNETVEDEQFSPERTIIDPETKGTVPYRYYSSNLSYKRAIEPGDRCRLDNSTQTDRVDITSPQEMEDTCSSDGCDIVQNQPQESSHLSHMAERKEGLATIHEELGIRSGPQHCNSEGKLECCGIM